jgi:hypothetical protein
MFVVPNSQLGTVPDIICDITTYCLNWRHVKNILTVSKIKHVLYGPIVLERVQFHHGCVTPDICSISKSLCVRRTVTAIVLTHWNIVITVAWEIDLGTVGFAVPANGLVNERHPFQSTKSDADFYNRREILAFLLLFQFQITNLWEADCLL